MGLSAGILVGLSAGILVAFCGAARGRFGGAIFDGGTRTASITGACVALVDAISHIQEKKAFKKSPLKQLVASVSVGIFKGSVMLDLDYVEDSAAETDMNVVMTDSGGYIEIQGTGEDGDFDRSQLLEMLEFADLGICELIKKQKTALDF